MAAIQMTLYLVAIVTCMCTAIVTGETCSGEGRDQDPPKLDPPPKHYNIILVGALGDLAQKYLWQGLFELYARHFHKGQTAFSIYACGRTKADEGRQKLSSILLDVVKCGTREDCRSLKPAFVQITQYHELRTESDYVKLGEKLTENSQSMYGLRDTDWTAEEGRLVYFSIPPKSYLKTAQFVHKHLRPTVGRGWLRLVLEKPFGDSKESAQKLARHLGGMYKEEEMYRVDHYLGKPLVKNILTFREANRGTFGDKWNHQYIERVEIVMKEAIDCKGRMSFYDDVGIVRDVMQNHLTEMMALVAMELPGTSATINKILRHKLELLRQVPPLDVSSTVIGQYETYETELQIEQNDTELHSRTSTFASTVVHIHNARWRGVPFVFTSGKKLSEKASYIRIVFRNNQFCLHDVQQACGNSKGQMVFLISSSNPKLPSMISVSKSLGKPNGILGWKFSDLSDNEFSLFGEENEDAFHLVPDSLQRDAYATLIEAVFEGQRHLFTNTEVLLASWDIWSQLVKTLDTVYPRKYLGGDEDKELLTFHVLDNKAKFAKSDEEVYQYFDEVLSKDELRMIPDSFLDQTLRVDVKEKLLQRLSDMMQATALAAVEERGVFHLALPGGASPRPILNHISHNAPLFPWQQTHIWQVDERCVETSSKDSNFKWLEENLLRIVDIPYANVHPMPLHMLPDLCDPKYSGDLLYEAMIKRHVFNASLDVIVLGMGLDGHVASLFPKEDTMDVTDRLVLSTEVKHTKVVSPHRMTVSLPLINAARNVVMLIIGKYKHSALEAIAKDSTNMALYPVLSVRPASGNMTWFIDNEAFFG